MRILLIAPQPFYSDRGTPMNVRLLSKVLGEAGHNVDLLVFPAGWDIDLKNVKIIRLPNILRVDKIPIGMSKVKLMMDLLMVITVFWYCLVKKYDVIHGIEEGGIMAVAFSKLFRHASVFDMDSWIPDQLKYSGSINNQFILNSVMNIEKWAINNCSIVLTVCTSLTEKVRSISRDANIVQLEDIPLPELNKYKQEDMEVLIDTYDLRNCYRITYTGNLEKYQGIDLLLDAWLLFIFNKKTIRDCKLVIVGGDNRKLEHYRKTTKEKGLTDTICWVGQRSANEMGAWMALSDVLVSPRSDGDNTPLKIFSYMAASRPIVATRRTTHTQVLDDSTAFLSEPEPEDFSEAIMKALNNREEALKKSDLAKKTVEIKCSYTAFSKKLLDAYSSIKQTV